MPHIIIEHSTNLAAVHDIQALVDAVHSAALADGLPPLDALRTRAHGTDNYRIADGNPSHMFVTITARIGPGRSSADIDRFLNCLIDTVDAELTPIAQHHAVALSAEVQLIDPDLRINRNHVRTWLEQGAP